MAKINYTIISASGLSVSGGTSANPESAIARAVGASEFRSNGPAAIQGHYSMQVKVGGYWKSVEYRVNA